MTGDKRNSSQKVVKNELKSKNKTAFPENYLGQVGNNLHSAWILFSLPRIVILPLSISMVNVLVV